LLAGAWGYGSVGRTAGGVNEPEYIWKAIFANGKWTCWMMKNESTSLAHDINYWQISIAQFNTQTGLHLR
jgi:hypothetical protein